MKRPLVLLTLVLMAMIFVAPFGQAGEDNYDYYNASDLPKSNTAKLPTFGKGDYADAYAYYTTFYYDAYMDEQGEVWIYFKDHGKRIDPPLKFGNFSLRYWGRDGRMNDTNVVSYEKCDKPIAKVRELTVRAVLANKIVAVRTYEFSPDKIVTRTTLEVPANINARDDLYLKTFCIVPALATAPVGSKTDADKQMSKFVLKTTNYDYKYVYRRSTSNGDSWGYRTIKKRTDKEENSFPYLQTYHMPATIDRMQMLGIYGPRSVELKVNNDNTWDVVMYASSMGNEYPSQGYLAFLSWRAPDKQIDKIPEMQILIK